MYSKSEYTTIIGQYVRPAVYTITLESLIQLSWNFVHRMISVEFEDEKDPSRNDWVIEKIVIFDQTIPEGGVQGFFFKKNFFLRII